jgi:ABC-2 type transport system ATP-binding protein
VNQPDWVIDTHGLSKSYKEIHALKELDLRVPEHSIFGFLGPNGAGKTTTIKLLLGLIRPSAGSANVFGLDVVRDSVAIRARIGYLPQDPRFYEHMSARQILDYTAHFFFRGPQSEIDLRVSETLELVGLSDKADRPIKGFSGGERQRVGIAQAQVNYPDLLILDEPAGSLDPMGRQDVPEVMERLREHTTILHWTHILDDVQRVSDAVAILNHGKLIAAGPIGDILSTNQGGVAYEVGLKGATEKVYQQVASQAWVTGINKGSANGSVKWTVNVSDPGAAEANLFRMLAQADDVIVTDYHVKENKLEDVFLRLVEGVVEGGEQNGKR